MTLRTCVCFDPAVPACRQIGTASMTGFSVMTWLRVTETWITTRTPILCANNAYSGWSRVNVGFNYSTGWRVRLRHRRTTGEPLYVTEWYLPESFFNGKFHSIAVTHNDGTNQPAAFLDRVALTRVPASTWDPVIDGTPNQEFWAFTSGAPGGAGFDSNSMHNAMVGDIKVWDRDLTEAQLLAEVRWGSVIDPTNLMFYYTFVEQAGRYAYGVRTLDLNRTDRWCTYEEDTPTISGTIIQTATLTGSLTHTIPETRTLPLVTLNIYAPQSGFYTVARLPDAEPVGDYYWTSIPLDGLRPATVMRPHHSQLILRDLQPGRYLYRFIVEHGAQVVQQDYLLLVRPSSNAQNL